MQKKSFQIFQKEFFSNSTSFLLKKSYIPSNIAPFNYPGTLRVMGPGSGPGPGNGKSQKTGSGLGTPYLVFPGTRVIHYPVQHYLVSQKFVQMDMDAWPGGNICNRIVPVPDFKRAPKICMYLLYHHKPKTWASRDLSIRIEIPLNCRNERTVTAFQEWFHLYLNYLILRKLMGWDYRQFSP